MTRRRRWIIVMGGLATILVVTAGVLREVSYTGRLPREMAARMPAHWRIPWGLDPKVREGIEGLYSADPKCRAEAAMALEDCGPPAVPWLVALLADGAVPPQGPPAGGKVSLVERLKVYFPGPEAERKDKASEDIAREEAIHALVDIGQPAAEPLIAALQDPLWQVSACAATVLGDIGDERAVDPLADAWAVHRSWEGFREYPEADALARIGGRGIDILIEHLGDADPATRITAAMALGHCRGDCPRAVEALAAALNDADPVVVHVAADSLSHFRGDQATTALVAALDNPRQDVRRAAALGLGGKPSARAVEALIAAVDGGRLEEERSVAATLGRIGDPRSVEPLIRWLSRAPPGARWEMAGALEELRDRRAVDSLLAVVGAADSEREDRSSAVVALGKIGDDRAVPALIRLLGDKDEVIVQEAKKSLGRIGDDRAVPALIEGLANEGDYDENRTGQTALARIGSPAVEPLVAVLNEAKRGPLAACVLGRIGDHRALGPLLEAMKSENSELRQAATRAIGRLGDARAFAPLVEALNHEVAFDAAEGLGYLGDPRAVEPILAAIERYDRAVDKELKAPKDKIFREAMKSCDPNLTPAGIALIRLGEPRGLTLFLRSWPPDNRYEQAGNLQDVGPEGIKMLAHALADEDKDVRIAAAFCLMSDGSPEAVAAVVAAFPALPPATRQSIIYDLANNRKQANAIAALAQILRTDKDWRTRMKAIEELMKRGDPVAADALRRAAAEDPSRHVRLAAAKALE